MDKNENRNENKNTNEDNYNVDKNEINGILDSYDSDKYEEVMISLKDLKEGDKVKGSDGKWYDIEILPIIIPDRMFKITFIGEKRIKDENNEVKKINTYGSTKCSGDHLWTLFDPNTSIPLTVKSEDIYGNVEHLKKHTVGDKNGPKIYSIEEIESLPSRCVSLKGSKDMLFEILLDNEDVENDNVNNNNNNDNNNNHNKIVDNTEDNEKSINDTLFEVERR